MYANTKDKATPDAAAEKFKAAGVLLFEESWESAIVSMLDAALLATDAALAATDPGKTSGMDEPIRSQVERQARKDIEWARKTATHAYNWAQQKGFAEDLGVTSGILYASAPTRMDGSGAIKFIRQHAAAADCHVRAGKWKDASIEWTRAYLLARHHPMFLAWVGDAMRLSIRCTQRAFGGAKPGTPT